jgi:uncharacterized repeat protein (TIGR03803 family)
VIDGAGTIFGTTPVSSSPPAYGGCVFALTQPDSDGSAWKFSVIHEFEGIASGSDSGDGDLAVSPVVMDGTGALYGTTVAGGKTCSLKSPLPTGCGTVYKLTPPAAGHTVWTDTILWRFTGGHDGAFPYAGLLLKDGAIYGTASGGGDSGFGTVFRIVP